MVDKILGGTTVTAIKAALDGLAARQRAISNNVANIDTPGFKRSQVRFEDQLRSAMNRGQPKPAVTLATTNTRHIADLPNPLDGVQPETVTAVDTSLRNDGNNVDIDQEMVLLADTSIKYNAAALIMSRKIGGLKNVISDGKG